MKNCSISHMDDLTPLGMVRLSEYALNTYMSKIYYYNYLGENTN